MARFRKKPVIVEAEQFTHLGIARINFPKGIYPDKTSRTGYSIDTLEGKHEVSADDWIITGVKGEKYPCKPDIFEMTYEKVE